MVSGFELHGLHCTYMYVIVVCSLLLLLLPLQASLERVGVDHKGMVYWYDGGRNMFQSPPSSDCAYKPR